MQYAQGRRRGLDRGRALRGGAPGAHSPRVSVRPLLPLCAALLAGTVSARAVSKGPELSVGGARSGGDRGDARQSDRLGAGTLEPPVPVGAVRRRPPLSPRHPERSRSVPGHPVALPSRGRAAAPLPQGPGVRRAAGHAGRLCHPSGGPNAAAAARSGRGRHQVRSGLSQGPGLRLTRLGARGGGVRTVRCRRGPVPGRGQSPGGRARPERGGGGGAAGPRWPDKVLFGTDAFEGGPNQGWEEGAYVGATTARRALGIALTAMVRDGDIGPARARMLARLVLRDNAATLYHLGLRS